LKEKVINEKCPHGIFGQHTGGTTLLWHVLLVFEMSLLLRRCRNWYFESFKTHFHDEGVELKEKVINGKCPH
jgi:hypothetical protein